MSETKIVCPSCGNTTFEAWYQDRLYIHFACIKCGRNIRTRMTIEDLHGKQLVSK